MTSEERFSYGLIIILAVVCIVLLAGWLWLRPRPPAPTPAPTMTATATRPPQPSRTATATRMATSTSVPSSTATETPTAPILPTGTMTPEPYAPPATATAARPAVRGVHRVVPGDTYWDVACVWYGDMPLRPGANPLTPCTCWPGIYWLNTGGVGASPQFLGVGWRLLIPKTCGQ